MAAQAPVPSISGAAFDVESRGPVRTLTLDEAVTLALEQNMAIRVERINPQLQDENVMMARAAFVPTLTSDLNYHRATTPPDSFLSGSQNTLKP